MFVGMEDHLFDRDGNCILQLRRGNLYARDGVFLGYIKEEMVINRKRDHVGWFRGGILRDRKGKVVAFSPRIRAGGPVPDLPELNPIPHFTRKARRIRRLPAKKTHEKIGFSGEWSRKRPLDILK